MRLFGPADRTIRRVAAPVLVRNRLHADRIALNGVMDHRFPVDASSAPWHFSAIGDGHDVATWSRLIGALQAAGHDSVVSIEHEDPSLTPEESITRSAATLKAALGATR